MKNVNRDLILSGPFLDAALKRSEDVEDLLELCGRIKVQRAAVAIVETYLEMQSPDDPVEDFAIYRITETEEAK